MPFLPAHYRFKSFFTSGVLCLMFGIAILIQPDLIAYFVAILLILVGSFLLGSWWNLRR